MAKQCFAFVFPMMPGDLNPSLPIARSLVELGHEVHYLCFEQFRAAIVDTGASFHSAVECEAELYEGHEAGAFGAIVSMKADYPALADVGQYRTRVCLNHVQIERQLPGLLRFLEEIKPHAIVYDPVVCPEAALAAQVTKIPTVSLLCFAGPGGWADTVGNKLVAEKLTADEMDAAARSFEPNTAAVERLNATYGLSRHPGYWRPVGILDPIPPVVLVTTTEDLRQPEATELARAYEEAGTSFAYLGPLLDKAGAKRAGGFKMDGAAAAEGGEDDLMPRVHAAKAAGRTIVLASMGTVATGDNPTLGWNGRPRDSQGQPRGLSGRELCQAAWAGIFDAAGSGSADEGALILVTLGPQENALGDIAAPPNAICLPFLPQVDILRAGVGVFVTHGGQNSFMESLSQSTPVLVCPTAGDQFDNAKKAVEIGVGLDAGRPDPDPGCEADAIASHRSKVSDAVQQILKPGSAFKPNVEGVAERLRGAGGVPRAVDIILAHAQQAQG